MRTQHLFSDKCAHLNLAAITPPSCEPQSKPGTKMVNPEPCKEFRRRPQLPSPTRVLIVAQVRCRAADAISHLLVPLPSMPIQDLQTTRREKIGRKAQSTQSKGGSDQQSFGPTMDIYLHSLASCHRPVGRELQKKGGQPAGCTLADWGRC